jgi:competence protein ComEC
MLSRVRPALAAVGLVLGVLAAPVAGQEVPHGPAPLIVRFLDVGQGDGAWLTTPDGRTVLVDCGPGSYGRRLVADLIAAGVDHIDYLAPSHAHADHMGGCIEVVRQLPVSEVLWTGQTDTSLTWRTFWDAVQTRGIPVTRLEVGQVFAWGGGATATVYNPVSHADGSRVDEYDDSHVLLVDYFGTRVLFVGDLHTRGERRALAAGLPTATILKLAEHGSAEGSSAEFLTALKPNLGILSYAQVNAFDLPNPIVMNRLQQLGIASLSTADHGTITITVDGYTVATDH